MVGRRPPRRTCPTLQAYGALMPTSEDLLNQGWQLHQQGQLREAEQAYRQVLAIEPGHAAAWCYLGMVSHDQELFDQAVFAFQQAIGLAPGMAVAYHNFGKTLGRMRRFDDAIACFDQSIALSPAYVNAHKNKAKAHYFKGDLDGAMAAHQQVLRLAPDDAETHMNIGMLWLLHNDGGRGWPEYQWREKTKDGELPQVPQPLWDGSSLDAKSILLTPEQGIGDCVQFVRYAAVLKDRFKCHVLFHCPRALMQLLQKCRGIDQLVEQTTPAPQTDFFAPLLHVPAVLGQRPLDFPGQVPYLAADESLVATWRQRLADYRGKRIGIAWRGSPKHPADRMRSIALGQFAPLASVPGVQLFSLQKGPGSEELAAPDCQFNIIDLGRQLDETTGAFV